MEGREIIERIGQTTDLSLKPMRKHGKIRLEKRQVMDGKVFHPVLSACCKVPEKNIWGPWGGGTTSATKKAGLLEKKTQGGRAL